MMKWDWIFFDADETLFTFDSFTGLQRMFLDYSVTFTAEDFRDYRAVNKPLWVDYQNGAITSLQLQHARFQSWAERLNVAPGLLNDALLVRWRRSVLLCRAPFRYLMRFAGRLKSVLLLTVLPRYNKLVWSAPGCASISICW